MFSKMLVATDLSEVSEQAICALGDLKHLGTREAVLVHVFNIRDVGTLADRLMEMAKPAFDRQKKLLEDMGYAVDARMVLGLPQIEINNQADEHDCSLVVIGSTGGSMVREIILGGVASAVLHNATRPVLLLHLREKDEKGEPGYAATCDPLKHILFPTDFSDNAEHAFAYVNKIAKSGAKRITLLHVQDKGRIDKHLKHKLDEFNETDNTRLSRLKDNLVKHGVQTVDIEIPYGSPKEEIISWIRKTDVSLVVMGSQGRGFFGEMLLGSVSNAVARHSTVPVLMIPVKQ